MGKTLSRVLWLMKHTSKNSGQNNDSYEPWHNKIGKEIPLEIKSTSAWSKDTGWCQGKQIVLRVDIGKHKLCGLTQAPRSKGTVINLKNQYNESLCESRSFHASVTN